MLSSFQENKLKNTDHNSLNQYVVFLVGEEEFGVNIKQTREIINTSELTFIPNAPDFVKGVINLRGEIVPVIDLNKRLSIDKIHNTDDEKIIIVELDNNLVGMKVRDVKEIIRLNQSDIGNPPKITRGIKKDFVTGVGKLENRLLILLNLNKVITEDEIEQIDQMDI